MIMTLSEADELHRTRQRVLMWRGWMLGLLTDASGSLSSELSLMSLLSNTCTLLVNFPESRHRYLRRPNFPWLAPDDSCRQSSKTIFVPAGGATPRSTVLPPAVAGPLAAPGLSVAPPSPSNRVWTPSDSGMPFSGAARAPCAMLRPPIASSRDPTAAGSTLTSPPPVALGALLRTWGEQYGSAHRATVSCARNRHWP